MNLDRSDEENTALIRELDRIIEDDRFPMSPRIVTLKAILAKLRPAPALLVPPKVAQVPNRSGNLYHQPYRRGR
jgi:hypothetical protein